MWYTTLDLSAFCSAFESPAHFSQPLFALDVVQYVCSPKWPKATQFLWAPFSPAGGFYCVRKKSLFRLRLGRWLTHMAHMTLIIVICINQKKIDSLSSIISGRCRKSFGEKKWMFFFIIIFWARSLARIASHASNSSRGGKKLLKRILLSRPQSSSIKKAVSSLLMSTYLGLLCLDRHGARVWLGSAQHAANE